MNKELLSATEVAELFQVNKQRIYELCRTDPTFPVIRLGQRQYRFPADQLERWVESGGSKQGGEDNEEKRD